MISVSETCCTWGWMASRALRTCCLLCLIYLLWWLLMTLRLLFCSFLLSKTTSSWFILNALVCPLQNCYLLLEVRVGCIYSNCSRALWWIARVRHGKGVQHEISKQRLWMAVGFWINYPKRQLSFVPLQMSPAPIFWKAHVLINQ